MDFLEPLQVIWDYLGMHQTPEKADVIVGFGNFNTNIARRAAELYLQGLAPWVLFTGGLGRNTEGLLPEPDGSGGGEGEGQLFHQFGGCADGLQGA